MTTADDVAARFEREGGRFVAPAASIAANLERTRALVFDWDGVFNRGEKSTAVSSGFNEADSMGINMLRFAFWLQHRVLPVTAIVTGEANPSSEAFAERERFDFLYQGVRDKRLAIADLCRRRGLEPAEIACVFDDINDISMAASCGIRVLVRRRASLMFQEYVVANSVCDYITACESGCHAVRETAELLLALLASFDVAVESRVAYDDSYRAYFAERQAITLQRPSVAARTSADGAE